MLTIVEKNIAPKTANIAPKTAIIDTEIFKQAAHLCFAAQKQGNEQIYSQATELLNKLNPEIVKVAKKEKNAKYTSKTKSEIDNRAAGPVKDIVKALDSSKTKAVKPAKTKTTTPILEEAPKQKVTKQVEAPKQKVTKQAEAPKQEEAPKNAYDLGKLKNNFLERHATKQAKQIFSRTGIDKDMTMKQIVEHAKGCNNKNTPFSFFTSYSGNRSLQVLIEMNVLKANGEFNNPELEKAINNEPSQQVAPSLL